MFLRNLGPKKCMTKAYKQQEREAPKMGNKYKVNDNGKTFDEEEKRLIISTHSMLTSFWKRQ